MFAVPPKAGQKRPATSPAPILPPQSHHHLQSGQLPNHIVSHLVPQPLGTATSASNATTGRGPFASALRNLAKQADSKDDDVQVVGAGVAGGGGGGSSSSVQQRPNSEARSNDGRASSGLNSVDNRNVLDDRNVAKKKTISPQPPSDKASHQV